MPPGLQGHLAAQRFLNFILDTVEIEDRALPRIVLQAGNQLGNVVAGKLLDFLEILPGVDPDFFQIRAHQIAHGAHIQGQVFIDNRRRGAFLHLALQGRPQPLKILDVRGQFFFADTLGGCSQDKTAHVLHAFTGDHVFDRLAHTGAHLLVVDALGHADVPGLGHVNQIAGRHRQVGGQPRALGADGVLDHLGHQTVALA